MHHSATSVLLDGLGADRLTRVVDVGANPLTPPPYAELLEMRGCEVWGFEPQPEAFAELQKTKSDLETYFPYAVGDGSALTLNLYRESGLTSLFEPYEGAFSYLGRSRRNMERLEQISLETKRLDDMAELGALDVLKIDIQGGEVMVFEGGQEKLAKASVVIPEIRYYPLYEDEPMFGGVDVELRRQGFVLHKLMFEKTKVIPNSQIDRIKRAKMRNQVIDGDAVYVRDLGQIDRYTDAQLMHLSVAASGIFESHDMVLFCLDRLAERNAAPADLAGRYVDALPKQLRKT